MNGREQKTGCSLLDARSGHGHLVPAKATHTRDALEQGSAHDAALLTSAFTCAPRAISETEFLLFQNVISREAGIWLSPTKTALLVGRLAKRMRFYGLKSFNEYYSLVTESEEELHYMLDAITTNETHFFREPKHFELLQASILPNWVAEADAGYPRRIRAWSAGCSSGQEPYSLAMLLLDVFPPGCGWDIQIMATDLSTRVLDTAARGIYPAEAACEIPREYLKAFMLKGLRDQADKIKVAPEIQSVVRFFHLNLKDPSYPFSDKFDLIFCRNVLIYFDLHSRKEILSRLMNYLRPGGYLFLGHAEGLPATCVPMRIVIPTVYQLNERCSHRNGTGQ